MNATICDLPRYVEPGALPKRVRFYPERRKIAAMTPVKAFAYGAAIGCAATLVGAVVLCLFSGCETLRAAREDRLTLHPIPEQRKIYIEGIVGQMDEATRGIVFQPTKAP